MSQIIITEKQLELITNKVLNKNVMDENKDMKNKKVIKLTENDVTVVDRHNYQTFLPLLYQVSTAGLAADHVAHPVRGVLNKKGIKDNAGQSLKLDGSIGNLPNSKSAQAIAKYQTRIGVESDGVWGYNTSTKMPPADKKLYDDCFSENSGIIDKMAKGISDLFN